MNDCVSCGLVLPAGVATCPACGTSQALELAAADQARCALHAEVQATGTCSRCGRFMCVECAAVDVGVCRSCFDSSRRDVQARLASLNVRLGWLAVAQGLLAPALSFRSKELFWLMAGFGVFSVAFGLVTIARRELWIIGLVACGIIGVLSFFALFDAPQLIVCVALTLLEVRLANRSSVLERDAWLLRKP